jgi:hypothetical protein
MGNMTHHEIASAFMIQLGKRGMKAFAVESASGSVYVYIVGSRQKIRIADHRKHRGWFRYNIRSDLRESREFRISGQRVFLFAESNLIRAANQIAKDFKDDRRRGEGALVKTRKRRKYRGDEKSRRAEKSAERAE